MDIAVKISGETEFQKPPAVIKLKCIIVDLIKSGHPLYEGQCFILKKHDKALFFTLNETECSYMSDDSTKITYYFKHEQ